MKKWSLIAFIFISFILLLFSLAFYMAGNFTGVLLFGGFLVLIIILIILSELSKKKKFTEPAWRIILWEYYSHAFPLAFFNIMWPTRRNVRKERKKYMDFYRLRKVCELKNKEFSISEISKKLKIKPNEVRKYLKRSKKYTKDDIKLMPNMTPEVSLVSWGAVITITLLIIYLITIGGYTEPGVLKQYCFYESEIEKIDFDTLKVIEKAESEDFSIVITKKHRPDEFFIGGHYNEYINSKEISQKKLRFYKNYTDEMIEMNVFVSDENGLLFVSLNSEKSGTISFYSSKDIESYEIKNHINQVFEKLDIIPSGHKIEITLKKPYCLTKTGYENIRKKAETRQFLWNWKTPP